MENKYMICINFFIRLRVYTVYKVQIYVLAEVFNWYIRMQQCQHQISKLIINVL